MPKFRFPKIALCTIHEGTWRIGQLKDTINITRAISDLKQKMRMRLKAMEERRSALMCDAEHSKRAIELRLFELFLEEHNLQELYAV